MTAGRPQWRGLIEEYREWLPVASLTYQPFDNTQLVAGWMANRTSSETVAGPSLSSAFVAYIQSF